MIPKYGERAFFFVVIMTVIALFALFIGETVWIRSTIRAAFNRQSDILDAQVERAFTLRWQLDEETGLRGYLATRRRMFLYPYTNARSRLPKEFDILRNDLHNIDPPLALYVDDEERINNKWLATTAHPLLMHPSRRDMTKIQIRGRFLIDQYRERDYAIFNALNLEAKKADDATSSIIEHILTYSIGLATLVGLILMIFAVFQGKLFQRLYYEHEAYEYERSIVAKLAQAFIQKQLPSVSGLQFDAIYMPAEEEAHVGGDWYDTFELPDKRVFFSIGDVTGHGVEAAVLMNRVRQMFAVNGLQETDPAVVLARINQLLVLKNFEMVTAICGYINPATMEICYATAGHPPPVLARSRILVSFLPHFGPPLGASSNPSYRTFRENATRDALFVLFTDGLLEYKRDIIAGEAALLHAVGETVTGTFENPATDLLRRIIGSDAPADDVAILTVSFK